MKRILLCVFLFGLTLASASTWVLDRNLLETKLPLGVSVEELTRVLAMEGIDTRFENRHDILWRGKKALAEVLGASGFMIFTTEQIRNGKGDSVGFEIIPSGFDHSNIMDAVEKNALNNYVFYNQPSLQKASHSSETLYRLRNTIASLQVSLEVEAPQGSWSQKFIHHQEASTKASR